MNAVAALDLVLALLIQAQKISLILKQAQSEGRDELTSGEWATIVAENDAARQALQDAIDRAKSEGR